MTHDTHPDGPDLASRPEDTSPEDQAGDLIEPTADPADDGDAAPAGDEPEQV